MPRARTGTIQLFVDAQGRRGFRARIRLADGSRPWYRVPDEDAVDDKTARAWAMRLQQREDREGRILASLRGAIAKPSETVAEWFARWFKSKRARGHTSTRDDEYRFNVWIKPRLGPKPIACVTSDDVEDVRDELDRAVVAWEREGKGRGRISGKTATNVWSVLTGGFREASSSKLRELRILPRGENPCAGVQPPERGATRQKPYVYPSEFFALAQCKQVPVEWRQVHAIAVFTYLRPGELRVLRWADVDLENAIVHVTKAWDYAAAREKAPKTRNGVRDVPIPAPLLPLLTSMHRDSKPEDLVVPVLSSVNEDTLAELTRTHLRAAGVERAALYANSTTTMAVGFRSWRDTGITWLAISGVDVPKMQRRAGHDDVSTTMRYVKAAEDLGGRGGKPFPALPKALSSVHRLVHRDTPTSPSKRDVRRIAVRRKGLEDGSSVGIAQVSSADRKSRGSAPPTKDADRYAIPGEVDHSVDCSEEVLEEALDEARRAGRWDVVAQIARELQARRLEQRGERADFA